MKRSSKKYYDNIKQLPVAVFSEVSKTGDLQQLVISGGVSKKQLVKAWQDITGQFIKEFGLNESYKKYLSLMTQVILLNHDIYVKGQKWKKIKAKVKSNQANSLISLQGAVRFSEQIAEISKKMGFRVDPYEVSVFEFYGYIKHLNNGR